MGTNIRPPRAEASGGYRQANARRARMIAIEYEIKDTEGAMLSTSAVDGPMRFIFGKGQVWVMKKH